MPSRHLASHNDLECSLTQLQFGKILIRVTQAFVQKTVESVTLPVEFLLKGNHPTPEAYELVARIFQSFVSWHCPSHDLSGSKALQPAPVDPGGGREGRVYAGTGNSPSRSR